MMLGLQKLEDFLFFLRSVHFYENQLLKILERHGHTGRCILTSLIVLHVVFIHRALRIPVMALNELP